MDDNRHEFRCFCVRKPLLAIYGLRDDKPYVHVRIYKQQRIYGEIELEFGTIRIKCRDCFRWHKISIKKGKVSLNADS